MPPPLPLPLPRTLGIALKNPDQMLEKSAKLWGKLHKKWQKMGEK
jgi:hypothetical protein